MTLARMGGFPGLYCPGLIEAGGGHRSPGHRRRFPGLYCPGLIEARGTPGSGALRTRCFRGSIAPASLKHSPGEGLELWRHGFRGSIAPASLKHVHAALRLRSAHEFPGLYCPGLIEAKPRTMRSVTRRGVSGALLPRPH